MKPVFTEKTAPCREACPAGNHIAKVMTLIVLGRDKEALSALKEENPLPGVCGRVCPHPCVTACNRGGFDDALSVHTVERFLGDQAAALGSCIPEPMPASGKRIAVIGSGPAGLGMAYHGALLGHAVTIYEKEAQPGGLLRYGIPTYRLPREVLDRDLQFIEQLGITLVANTPIDTALFKTLQEEFDAICIATGAAQSHRLAIKGETSSQVIPGLDFLKALHLGAPQKPGKKTVVIGGGNTAMDAARCARRLGAEVMVLYRRSREDMPAIANEIEEAMEEGITFKFFAAPIEIDQHNGKLSSVRCIEMKPGEPDASGRRRPEPIDGSDFSLDADTIITAVGESVTFPFFDRVEGTGTTPIETDAWGGTSHTKVFVCGDAGPNTRTVAHALGSGKRAAMRIDAFLANKEIATEYGNTVSMSWYRNRQDPLLSVVEPKDINLAYFIKSPSLSIATTNVSDRLKGFDEIHPTGDTEAVTREAGRCFSCGLCNSCGTCFVFCPDMSVVLTKKEPLPSFIGDYCKGCGICARECPRGIIDMVEEEK